MTVSSLPGCLRSRRAPPCSHVVHRPRGGPVACVEYKAVAAFTGGSNGDRLEDQRFATAAPGSKLAPKSAPRDQAPQLGPAFVTQSASKLGDLWATAHLRSSFPRPPVSVRGQPRPLPRYTYPCINPIAVRDVRSRRASASSVGGFHPWWAAHRSFPRFPCSTSLPAPATGTAGGGPSSSAVAAFFSLPSSQFQLTASSRPLSASARSGPPIGDSGGRGSQTRTRCSSAASQTARAVRG